MNLKYVVFGIIAVLLAIAIATFVYVLDPLSEAPSTHYFHLTWD